MKKLILAILCLALFFLPLLILPEKTVKPAEQQTSNACEISITVADESVPLETYLVGVIAGEMPASFHVEALKAQAIAARTYALHQTSFGKSEIQATTAHQVYETKQQRQEKWKTVFGQHESKIEQAVAETKGLVATYDGELITAMFHAASVGETESAKNYSGQEIPYLQSVQTFEELTESELRYTLEEMNNRVKIKLTMEDYKNHTVFLNDSNRVDKVMIGTGEWSGREFRELFQLKSTNFMIETTSNQIIIRVKGNGHGVGMSQYGANEMAYRDLSAADIINHYYKGVEIQQYECE